MTISNLPTNSILPNDYNPNRMSPDEFAELVTEIRHLGRLPKPIVVVPSVKGYMIVDGEHGWRAAREVGLETLQPKLSRPTTSNHAGKPTSAINTANTTR